MRLIALTIVVLIAFAANSVLNRLGVARYGMDPAVFAVVRTAAGALVLAALVWRRSGRLTGGLPARRVGAAAALALYMAGFSLAYLTLDAGVGALILFGGVQITMFAGAMLAGDAVSRRRAVGAAIAFSGLVLLVWPSGAQAALSPMGVVLMLAAALGWGVYSLMGKGEANPLAATAVNFLLCLPMVAPLLFWADVTWPLGGVLAALVAGGVTSGLGYALWYVVVPRIGTTRAAVAQLSVPVIAAFGGVLFLGEAVTLTFVISAAIVIGGIAVSLGGPVRR